MISYKYICVEHGGIVKMNYTATSISSTHCNTAVQPLKRPKTKGSEPRLTNSRNPTIL